MTKIIKKEFSNIAIDILNKNFVSLTNISFSIPVAKHYTGALTDECRFNLGRIVSVIDTHVDELLNGKIQIGDMLLFLQHSKQFVEIAKLVKETEVEQEKCSIEKNLQTALEIRKKEYDELQSRAKLMVSMTTLCKKLTKGK